MNLLVLIINNLVVVCAYHTIIINSLLIYWFILILLKVFLFLTFTGEEAFSSLCPQGSDCSNSTTFSQHFTFPRLYLIPQSFKIFLDITPGQDVMSQKFFIQNLQYKGDVQKLFLNYYIWVLIKKFLYCLLSTFQFIHSLSSYWIQYGPYWETTAGKKLCKRGRLSYIHTKWYFVPFWGCHLTSGADSESCWSLWVLCIIPICSTNKDIYSLNESPFWVGAPMQLGIKKPHLSILPIVTKLLEDKGLEEGEEYEYIPIEPLESKGAGGWLSCFELILSWTM